jgi:transposase
LRVNTDEVLASGREGWVLIGEERSDRLAFRRALFFCMRVVREKWVRPVADPMAVLPSSLIVTAAQPDYVWPNVMADPSVITDVILSKYDYLLPLNRQERQTRNRGFVIPRSTQSDWLSAAYELLRHVVDAMHADSIANSHCIATDATGAPVRALRQCLLWHVFVFISDRGHVTFRHSRRHTSKVILALLEGFTGRLLSDASSIYDALFRIGIIAVSCWAHYPESVVIRIACPISRQTRDRADFAPRIIRDLSHPSFAREMSQGRDPGSRVRRGSGSARRPVTHWTRRIGLCETLLLSRAGARFQSTCIGVPNS